MSVERVEGFTGDANVDVAIIGAGACGLVAALAAGDAGARVLVLERDAVPGGSTALSSGFIPACGTRWQREARIGDDAGRMCADIMSKAHGRTDASMAALICRESAPALEWLADAHGLDFELLEGFTYPGHSRLRMHAVPERTGRALADRLGAAAERARLDVLANATVTRVFADRRDRVRGVEAQRPDGTRERIACEKLVLACNGFGGNPKMVARYIPEMRDALYFGHAGNQGDAVLWGAELGGALRDMGAYQGHGSVASPHGILITWALMMEGAIQVNRAGERFSNEHEGYSEQSVAVLAQPDRTAFNVYDERLRALGRGFPDFRDAEAVGAVRRADTVEAVGRLIGADTAAIDATLQECALCSAGAKPDRFGRDFTANPPLVPPYYVTRVTGALFHTQGGLAVDSRARVLRTDGSALANVYAGGGAARGLSGPAVWGYLSGNGLLTAVTLGRIAGRSAAGALA